MILFCVLLLGFGVSILRPDLVQLAQTRNQGARFTKYLTIYGKIIVTLVYTIRSSYTLRYAKDFS